MNNQEPMNNAPITVDVTDVDLEQISPLFESLLNVSIERVSDLRLSIFPDPEAPDTDIEETEPVFSGPKRRDVQGNAVPGFNKPFQRFLFLRIEDVDRAKKFLRWIGPRLTSMEEVLAFRRIYRSRRLGAHIDASHVREPAPVPLCAAWVNIAFSNNAITLLTSDDDLTRFGDLSFRQGMAERSTYLGDPTDPEHAGHRSNWLIGGPDNEADIVVIVGADTVADLDAVAGAVKGNADGLAVMFEQFASVLPGPMHGREHFGFRDGVSQPGIRGKASSAVGDFITPRYMASTDHRADYMAKPGQILVWPGEFLLGEPRQNPDDKTYPSAAASNFPEWAACGSYVVIRRLRQDVLTFWEFILAAARTLSINPVRLASMMVGRWPSGAPLSRVPAADNAALAGDEWANNHFIFDDNTRPAALRSIPGYGGDTYPRAAADILGLVCPHFAHIRKSNPRDVATDLGKPEDTITRLLLRRGIPFGPDLFTNGFDAELAEKERGLMFVSYGATIEEQFEFVTRRWINSDLQPNTGGIDPLIGQADNRGLRDRTVNLATPVGNAQLNIDKEWVTPTGGGYFFAPPIGAVSAVLGA